MAAVWKRGGGGRGPWCPRETLMVMRFQGSAGPQQLLPHPQCLLGSAIGSRAPRIKPVVGGGAGGCNLEPPGDPCGRPLRAASRSPSQLAFPTWRQAQL